MRPVAAGARFYLSIAVSGSNPRWHILGTYPNGNVSVHAVPRRPDGQQTPWIGTFGNEAEVQSWVNYLNQADLAGQINWNISLLITDIRCPTIKD